jgi:hypothetical protein
MDKQIESKIDKINLNKYIGKLVILSWLDAEGSMKETKSNLKSLNPKDLLILTTTYGRIFKVDGVATIILQEESDTECDYTCVPNSLIVDVQELI